MKILICGSGSIGKRHIQNLVSLGCEDIILYKTRKKDLPSFAVNFPCYFDLMEALDQQPKVAFITNPTSMHMGTALRCARSKCHLFIEKPLSHNLDNINDLISICKENKLVCMIGYMMRYHPLILRMRSYINSGKLGKIVRYRSFWGEDVSTWHPWEDYRKSYSTNIQMGGGPELTLSHDIDLALWLINSEVSGVSKIVNNNSNLKLNCNHGVDFNIRFNNKVTADIHLDYFTNPPLRNYDIVFEKGRVHFDYFNNEMRIVSKEESKTVISDDFERNDLFVSEIKAFLDALRNNKASPIGVEESVESLKIALTK